MLDININRGAKETSNMLVIGDALRPGQTTGRAQRVVSFIITCYINPQSDGEMQSNEQIYFVTPCETRWFVSTHWWWQGVSQHAHGALPPESIQTWEIKRKETFKIGRKAHLIWLHQLAKYPSLLLSECTLCQWGGAPSLVTQKLSASLHWE